MGAQLPQDDGADKLASRRGLNKSMEPAWTLGFWRSVFIGSPGSFPTFQGSDFFAYLLSRNLAVFGRLKAPILMGNSEVNAVVGLNDESPANAGLARLPHRAWLHAIQPLRKKQSPLRFA